MKKQQIKKPPTAPHQGNPNRLKAKSKKNKKQALSRTASGVVGDKSTQCKAVVVDSVISNAASSGNTKALEAVMTNQNGSGPNNDQIWQHMIELNLVVTETQGCGVCGYTSRKRSDVIRHVRCVHMKIRDFHCKVCDFKCFGSSSLNQHVKSVHLKIKDFVCELCGYGASRGADINKHLRSKHRLETKEFSQFIKRPSSKSPPPGSASSRASSRGGYDEEENDEESLIDDDGESGYQSTKSSTPPMVKSKPTADITQGAFLNPATTSVLKNITNEGNKPANSTDFQGKKSATGPTGLVWAKKSAPPPPPEPVLAKKSVAKLLKNVVAELEPSEAAYNKKTIKSSKVKQPKSRKRKLDEETDKPGDQSNSHPEKKRKLTAYKKATKSSAAKSIKKKLPAPTGNRIIVKHGRQDIGGIVQTSALDGMKCHVCNYSCEQRTKLMAHFEKAHIRRSEDNKDYKCAHCNYLTPLKVILKSHIITNHAR